eukprot:g641.t1
MFREFRVVVGLVWEFVALHLFASFSCPLPSLLPSLDIPMSTCYVSTYVSIFLYFHIFSRPSMLLESMLSAAGFQWVMLRTRRRELAVLAAVLTSAYYIRQRRSAGEVKPEPLNGGNGKPQKSKRKWSRNQMWRLIFKILQLKRDWAGQKYILSILACTAVFVLIDLRKARLQGQLFQQVFLGRSGKFWRMLVENVMVGLTLATCNKLLANIVSSLGRHWHVKIIKALHDEYFSNMAYYRLPGDVAPQDRLAHDVPMLTRQLSLVACDMVNATVQFCFYAIQIFKYGGRVKGMEAFLVGSPVAFVGSVAAVITCLSPNFAAMQKRQRVLESKYRSAQSRIQANAEAIALYGGEQFERQQLYASFANLSEHVVRQIKQTLPFDILKAFLVKYCQATIMMGIVLAPFFGRGSKRSSGSLEDNAKLLFEMRYLGDLILHEFYALGQMARLAHTMYGLGGLVDRVAGLMLEIRQCKQDRLAISEGEHGRILEGDVVSFEGVTIVTPAGRTLCTDLTFSVNEGEHLIVCGPNGAGKSSIFRCLGTLWPIPKGTITRPGGDKEGLISDVYYLPQKPYNVLGDLRDQITYPDHEAGARLSDQRLRLLLRMVELEYLLDMQAEEVTNWEDKLSLGETQRLAMARLFWHKPKYAILDECTSAVSLQMEARLFTTCRRMGITLITISHRPALQEYHNRMLILDGNGGWSLEDLPGSSSKTFKPAGIDRHQSFNLILQELQEGGHLSEHKKQGASLESMERIKISQGLWYRMLHLNRLMFASRTEEVCSLGSLAFLVIVRTWLSNEIAETNGKALNLLLTGDGRAFSKLIGIALLQGLGQAILGPSLEHLESYMSLTWRERLTKVILTRYMENQAYFKLKETMPDMKAIGQLDQLLAHDIEHLTEGVASLWHDLVKPIVDIVWFARSMWLLTGRRGLTWQYCYILGGTLFLRLVRPDLARLTAMKQKLDGQFRFVHARLQQHSESIAFFNGAEAERKIVEKHFTEKIEHQKRQKRKEHAYGVAQQFTGYFLPQNVVWALSMLYQEQYMAEHSGNSGNLSAEQQGKLGHDLRYLGAVVNHSFSAFGSIMGLSTKAECMIGHVHRLSKMLDSLDKVERAVGMQDQQDQQEQDATSLLKDTGRVHFVEGGDVVDFDKCDILTPNQTQVLARGMSWRVERGSGLLVTGPNGSGKSSVFRIMCGLWPLHKGTVTTPSPQRDVFFVPTTPYMPIGTFLDQVTYPQHLELPISVEDEAKVRAVLEHVRLTYLLEREGLEKESDRFEHMFSLGEQQRLNVARALWHSPRFVCLDECTSAVALDGEEEIYRLLQANGITPLTSSQKPWLTNFHRYMLLLPSNGEGEWEFKEIDEESRFHGKTRLHAKAYVDKRQRDGSGGIFPAEESKATEEMHTQTNDGEMTQTNDTELTEVYSKQSYRFLDEEEEPEPQPALVEEPEPQPAYVDKEPEPQPAIVEEEPEPQPALVELTSSKQEPLSTEDASISVSVVAPSQDDAPEEVPYRQAKASASPPTAARASKNAQIEHQPNKQNKKKNKKKKRK